MKIFKYQHLRWTFLIIVAAVLTLTVSLLMPIGTLNSILQNIFAGLITGVVVTLIGSLKSRALKNVEIEQQFLEIVREEYKRSLEAYNTYRRNRSSAFDEETYELLSELEAVDHYIANKDKDVRLTRILRKKPSEFFDGDGYSLTEQMERHNRVYDLVSSKITFDKDERKEIETEIEAIRRAHRALNRKAINLQGDLFEKKLDIETSFL